MEKNNTRMKIAIVILCLLVVGLSGYIVYDKLLLDNNDLSENTNDDNLSDNKIENNISWIDYLLGQEFVSATLSVCSIDGDYVYDKNYENQPNPGVSRNITKEQLKKILNTIYESDSENSYGEIVKGYDYAAPACRDDIIYKYISDGKEYEFTLANASIIVTDDSSFIKILENEINSYPSYALNHNNSSYFDLVEDMMKEYIK